LVIGCQNYIIYPKQFLSFSYADHYLFFKGHMESLIFIGVCKQIFLWRFHLNDYDFFLSLVTLSTSTGAQCRHFVEGRVGVKEKN